MSDTLGSLVDKLSIVNIKLFMVQDVVYEAAAKQEGLDADTVAKLHNLNQQRNKLMTEVDQLIAEAVRTGKAEIDPHIKLV